VSKALLFLSRIGCVREYGDLAYVMLCNTLVFGVGVSSILAFRWESLPTLDYIPIDTELALGMTLLELHYVLQSWMTIKKTEISAQHEFLKLVS